MSKNYHVRSETRLPFSRRLFYGYSRVYMYTARIICSIHIFNKYIKRMNYNDRYLKIAFYYYYYFVF